MTKRLILLGLLVAAFLVLAAPALGFDGFRDTYFNTQSQGNQVGCRNCHEDGTLGPAVYNDYALTAHAQVGTIVLDPVTGAVADGSSANAEPIAEGPGCAGCHSGNYDTAKAVPNAAGVYPWENTPDITGDDAFSEPFVGCSACHYGKNVATNAGPSAAHSVPMANMASPDICGQCHSRYSNSVVPYPNYNGTSALRQYTRGDFSPLGYFDTVPPWTPQPIANYLLVPNTTAPQQMIYYTLGTETLPYNARAHEEGATQYNEWSDEGHARALDAIKAIGQGSNPQCLECHSTDFKLAVETGASSSDAAANAKYGVTCVGCHKPHKQSAQTSFWNEERNPQLTLPRNELCVQCHNAELAPQANGQPGVAKPGSAVHHPMKEMMAGTGAIDVPQGSPSVHKGKCVQCHMVPTSYDRNGVPQTGANHTFRIFQPEEAADAVTSAAIGGLVRNAPASSCSTCHKQDGTPYALYLQELLDNRQSAMQGWDAQVTTALGAAATNLGFTGSTDAQKRANANSALNAIGSANWSSSQLAFQKAFTNQQYIESEGSWGIHNWEYARTVILKAMDQAQSVTSVSVVTIKASATSVKVNKSVTISGRVNTSATGSVTIQKKKGSGSWATWKTLSLTGGSYSASFKTGTAATYYFRTKFAATATQVGGTSAQVKVVVKK